MEFIKTLLDTMLDKIPTVSQPQKKFLIICFTTILLMRGRVNFRNMSRYSDLSEKTYWRQFRTEFDFAALNKSLIEDLILPKSDKIATIDASYVPKSGDSTYGLDMFYDSAHKKPTRGLEISHIGIVDMTQNTAYTLSVRQTPHLDEIKVRFSPPFDKDSNHTSSNGSNNNTFADQKNGQNSSTKEKKEEKISRVDFYVEHVQSMIKYLPKNVKYLVADGYYSKFKFVNGIRQTELHLISKLRGDANLRYLYDEEESTGRKRKYDGKVKFNDLSRFDYIGEIDEGLHIYTKVVNSVNLKRNIRLVCLINKKGKNRSHVLLFSTDSQLDALLIYQYYKARFQQEFLFRDAKQFTGLCDCQARCKESLDFHFNASLTALNLAKSDAYKSFGYDTNTPFSMATQKTVYFNEHMMDKFGQMLELDLSFIRSHPSYDRLRTHGAIAP